MLYFHSNLIVYNDRHGAMNWCKAGRKSCLFLKTSTLFVSDCHIWVTSSNAFEQLLFLIQKFAVGHAHISVMIKE